MAYNPQIELGVDGHSGCAAADDVSRRVIGDTLQWDRRRCTAALVSGHVVRNADPWWWNRIRYRLDLVENDAVFRTHWPARPIAGLMARDERGEAFGNGEVCAYALAEPFMIPNGDCTIGMCNQAGAFVDAMALGDACVLSSRTIDRFREDRRGEVVKNDCHGVVAYMTWPVIEAHLTSIKVDDECMCSGDPEVLRPECLPRG